jgi:hypothetical protein
LKKTPVKRLDILFYDKLIYIALLVPGEGLMKSILSLSVLAVFSSSFFCEAFGATLAKPGESTTIVRAETDEIPGKTATLSVTREGNGSLSWLDYVGFDGIPIKFSISELISNNVVINKATRLLDFKSMTVINGTDVTYIRLEPGFSNLNGGFGTLRFLSNGISNSYLNFRFKLSVHGETISLESIPDLTDPDSDKNKMSGEFNYLFMKRKTFWGQTIGLSEIQPSLK